MRARLLLLAIALGGVSACASAPSTAELVRDLEEVRNYRDTSRPVTAFFLSERMRRAVGERFDDPFDEVFNGAPRFDPSARGEAALRRDIEAHPDDVVQRIRLADVYVYRRDWARAEAEARKALAIDPENREAIAFLARILAHDGRDAEAKQLVDGWVARHRGRSSRASWRSTPCRGTISRRRSRRSTTRSWISRATPSCSSGAR